METCEGKHRERWERCNMGQYIYQLSCRYDKNRVRVQSSRRVLSAATKRIRDKDNSSHLTKMSEQKVCRNTKDRRSNTVVINKLIFSVSFNFLHLEQ